MLVCQKDKYVATGEKRLSFLVVAGIIMLVVYLVPLILRPIDFLQNFFKYIVGLFCYLFMLPTFINVMQVYSMCNLHDISWGNRPSDTGV